MPHVESSSPARPPAAIIAAQPEPDGRVAIVQVDGELDLTSAPELKRTLHGLVSTGRDRLVLDLSQVAFMDSTALSVLVGIRRTLAADGRLAIAGTAGGVVQVFELSGLAASFRMFPTRDAALAYARTGVAEADAAAVTPLSADAALMLGIASTALPFAQSAEEEAERWLRLLRKHGDSGVLLASLGVKEAPIQELGDQAGSGELRHVDSDVISAVTERASRIAAPREPPIRVGTSDVLLAVMYIYGDTFSRVLRAHGGDVDELAERLLVARPDPGSTER